VKGGRRNKGLFFGTHGCLELNATIFQQMGPNIQNVVRVFNSVAEWPNCGAIPTLCCHFINALNA